ncbi:MAG: GNAT family N-acetyltransferase [Oligoflexia bacterium]|nr:GNAT family N-acetyltransferase [Oligoflexia bacterium]MBF0365477.1 GNAT family N-acetyltransferase [Oligoflexia bacterium]
MNTTPQLHIRKLQNAATDLPLAQKLIDEMDTFTSDEKLVAMELICKAIADEENKPETPPDYLVFAAFIGETNETMVGHICYGETPMTHKTFDLYWLTTHPRYRKQGVAKALMERMFEDLRSREARLIRTETAGAALYQGTRQFYQRVGMIEEATIKDFYSLGDDLSIFTYRF